MEFENLELTSATKPMLDPETTAEDIKEMRSVLKQMKHSKLGDTVHKISFEYEEMAYEKAKLKTAKANKIKILTGQKHHIED